MNKYVVVLPLLISIIAIQGQAQTNLIANGDFETGDFSDWDYSGVVCIHPEADYLNVGGEGSFASGVYALVFGGGDGPATGIISQEFSTMPGREYEIHFDYGRFLSGSGGPQSIRVKLINSLDAQTLFHTEITDYDGESNLADLFNEYSYTFIASGSITRLSFQDISVGTYHTDGLLDNVSVRLVPEPAAMLLLGSGLAGLVGFRRKFKKA